MKKLLLVFLFLLACGGTNGGSVALSGGEESWCRTWGSDNARSNILIATEQGVYGNPTLNYWKDTYFNAAETVGIDPKYYKNVYEELHPGRASMVCLDENGKKIDCMMTVEKEDFDWFIANIKNQNSKALELCKVWYKSVQGKSFLNN